MLRVQPVTSLLELTGLLTTARLQFARLSIEVLSNCSGTKGSLEPCVSLTPLHVLGPLQLLDLLAHSTLLDVQKA